MASKLVLIPLLLVMELFPPVGGQRFVGVFPSDLPGQQVPFRALDVVPRFNIINAHDPFKNAMGTEGRPAGPHHFMTNFFMPAGSAPSEVYLNGIPFMFVDQKAMDTIPDVNCTGRWVDGFCSGGCGSRYGTLVQTYNITTPKAGNGRPCPNRHDDVRTISCPLPPCGPPSGSQHFKTDSRPMYGAPSDSNHQEPKRRHLLSKAPSSDQEIEKMAAGTTARNMKLNAQGGQASTIADLLVFVFVVALLICAYTALLLTETRAAHTQAQTPPTDLAPTAAQIPDVDQAQVPPTDLVPTAAQIPDVDQAQVPPTDLVPTAAQIPDVAQAQTPPTDLVPTAAQIPDVAQAQVPHTNLAVATAFNTMTTELTRNTTVKYSGYLFAHSPYLILELPQGAGDERSIREHVDGFFWASFSIMMAAHFVRGFPGFALLMWQNLLVACPVTRTEGFCPSHVRNPSHTHRPIRCRNIWHTEFRKRHSDVIKRLKIALNCSASLHLLLKIAIEQNRIQRRNRDDPSQYTLSKLLELVRHQDFQSDFAIDQRIFYIGDLQASLGPSWTSRPLFEVRVFQYLREMRALGTIPTFRKFYEYYGGPPKKAGSRIRELACIRGVILIACDIRKVGNPDDV